MLDHIQVLNRLTLNDDGSVDKELFNMLLENCQFTRLFKKIANDILKIKLKQVCKSESSNGIKFKIKFDSDDSAIYAKNLIEGEVYTFRNIPYTVSVKQKNKELKLYFEGDE
ncbi:hypothetical protein V6O07_04965 [Arthrospira platensis SPKY2]